MKVLALINLCLLMFFVGSCATQDILMVQKEPSLPKVFYNTNLSSEYTYEPIIRLLNSENQFYCTGVVIDSVYALTAAHCVVNDLGLMSGDPINIGDSQGFLTNVSAKAVAVDRYRDVAFIKGDFSAFKPEQVDFTGAKISTGMKLKSCGYPGGQMYLYCVDLVQSGNRFFQYRTVGAPIFKGCSGGPVYDKDGVVVGVNSAVDEDTIIISPLVGVLESIGL